MGKNAKLRTKFDLLGKWKQNSNNRNFLKKHKREWEEILRGVTKDELDGYLYEYFPNHRIEDVKVKESHKGCWEILAYIYFSVSLNQSLKEGIKGLEQELRETFKERLNEKGRELLDSSEEEVIDVQEFEIDTNTDFDIDTDFDFEE
jgi:hypothetical protein